MVLTFFIVVARCRCVISSSACAPSVYVARSWLRAFVRCCAAQEQPASAWAWASELEPGLLDWQRKKERRLKNSSCVRVVRSGEEPSKTTRYRELDTWTEVVDEEENSLRRSWLLLLLLCCCHGEQVSLQPCEVSRPCRRRPHRLGEQGRRKELQVFFDIPFSVAAMLELRKKGSSSCILN